MHNPRSSFSCNPYHGGVIAEALVCFPPTPRPQARPTVQVAYTKRSTKVCDALKGTPLPPFPPQTMRQAVAQTVEELKMKPMMLNLVEA